MIFYCFQIKIHYLISAKNAITFNKLTNHFIKRKLSRPRLKFTSECLYIFFTFSPLFIGFFIFNIDILSSKYLSIKFLFRRHTLIYNIWHLTLKPNSNCQSLSLSLYEDPLIDLYVEHECPQQINQSPREQRTIYIHIYRWLFVNFPHPEVQDVNLFLRCAQIPFDINLETTNFIISATSTICLGLIYARIFRLLNPFNSCVPPENRTTLSLISV